MAPGFENRAMPNNSGVTIRPARAVDPARVEEFYRELYPHRPLAEIWRWLYRTSRADNPLPLVMMVDGRVVGHAGGIPFAARLGTRHLTAQWFVDFALLPEFRNRGLGTELTRAWVMAADVSVTFCNDASMSVFRRLGWIGSSDTALHTLWLRPSAHARLEGAPAIVRGAVDVGWQAVQAVAGVFGGTPELQLLDEEAIDALRAAMEAETAAPDGSARLTPIRDADYVAWRIRESPRRNLYRLFRGRDLMMLLRLHDREPMRLDVLWMSGAGPATHAEIQRMLRSLARWARPNGYSSIRYLPPDAALAASLRGLLPVVSSPQGAYWTADADLLQRLGTAPPRWHLLDSDFEWT